MSKIVFSQEQCNFFKMVQLEGNKNKHNKKTEEREGSDRVRPNKSAENDITLADFAPSRMREGALEEIVACDVGIN